MAEVSAWFVYLIFDFILLSISTEPELKAEVTCRTGRLKETLAAIKKVHPYEEPVINVIPLYMTGMDIVS